MKIANLSKAYGSRTLFSSLSFSLDRGIVQLCGPSGCGKSTLVRLCLGLEKPTDGEISYGSFSFIERNEKEIANFRNERLGYCGEGSSLLYSFSLRKNLFNLLPGADEKKRTDLCTRLSFTKLDKPLTRLSGGERHKAELIFAFLSEKETVFLDEPFSALDSKSKDTLVSIVNEYAETHLVVLINHDVGVKGLSISIKVDVPTSKVETFSLNPISDVAPSTVVPPKKKKVFSFFLADFFKGHWFEYAVESLLVVSSFVCLLYGLSSYPSRDKSSEGKLAMENDPFSSFVTQGSDADQHLEFDAFVTENADTACYFSSSADYRITLVSVKGLELKNTFYVDEDYGAAPSSVTLSGVSMAVDATYKLPEEKENYYLRSYKDGNKNNTFVSNGVYFVSPSFIDSFFEEGGFPALAIDGESGLMPEFVYSGDREIGFSRWGGRTALSTIIQTGSSDVLLLPGAEAGDKIKIRINENGDYSNLTLTASGSSPNATTMVVSPDYYRYLSYLLEDANNAFNFGLLPSFQINDVNGFLTNFSGSYITGVIEADYHYTQSIGNLLIAVGSGLLIFYLLIVCFSFAGKRRYFRNASFFLSLQGFTSFENSESLTCPFLIQGLSAAVIGLLFYGSVFIPFENNLIYQHVSKGSYVISRGLELYASTKSPLPFETFNPLSLLCFALFILIDGTIFFVLKLRQRSSGKMKRKK